MDEGQRPVLEAAALQGYRFDAITVARALGRPVLDIEDVLRRLSESTA